jgi:alkanesulfonate monooxygenase SsuD/methylene tetrahydromethanopterin reductase-like flavin-dependent oxidoreductase (luciferase family)
MSTRPLKVGVQLPEAERVVRWPELRDMAVAAEDIGFDSIWLGDHLLYRRPDGNVGPWEAWTSLAALAAVTSRVEIGPLVAATSFHSPAMLAKMAATVDEISGGRLILGLGAGWNEPDYTAFGFPYDQRAGRFEEAFTIIRTLLREGTIDFEGRFYTARDAELLPRGAPERHPNGPPLMIGSIGRRILRAGAPHMDAWNAWYSWFGNSPDGLATVFEPLDAALADAGRDPSGVIRTVAVLVQFGGGQGRRATIGDAPPPQDGTDPAAMARTLRRYAEAGIAHVQLVLDPITRDSIEQCAPILERLDRAA